MSDPLWVSGSKRKERKARKLERKKARANFVVEYDLAYEGGGSRWDGYYKTIWGARLDAFWQSHFPNSYGGSAEIYPYPKPAPVVKPKRKKGIFRGR